MEIDGRGRSISTAIAYEVWNALRDMEPGEEASVRTDALPAVDSDIRAWCRTAGHDLTGVEERDTERRYGIRKTDQPRAQPPWALVISDPGLEELLSPLGFALAARSAAARSRSTSKARQCEYRPAIQGEAQGSASRTVQPLRATSIVPGPRSSLSRARAHGCESEVRERAVDGQISRRQHARACDTRRRPARSTGFSVA